MINENDDYVTTSKLTITVKTLSKYNDRSTVAAKQTNKQTNRFRDTETGKNVPEKQKDLLTNRHISRLRVETHIMRGKQKLKMRPYVLLSK